MFFVGLGVLVLCCRDLISESLSLSFSSWFFSFFWEGFFLVVCFGPCE